MQALIRPLAWFALAAQGVFVACWLIAGALETHYSHVDQGVSELASRFAEHPQIVGFGLVVLGLSFLALAPGLLATLPRGPAAGIASTLVLLSGALMTSMAFLPLDCSFSSEACRAAFRAGELSTTTELHAWLGLVLQAAIVSTPFAVGIALRRNPLAFYAFGSGLFGVAVGLAGFALTSDDIAPGGLVNRFEYVLLHAWLVIVAIGILHATRRPPPPSELIPLVPRDFLGRPWVGEGELAPRPLFLGRHLAVRFPARRDTTWVSENVWLIDDEARFADGRVLRRHMFCEFVSEGQARLTAADMPDGGDVWLEEGGYRISPFRLSYAVGPLPVIWDCRDASRVEDDGTFVNVTEVRLLGLKIPLARLTFRVPAAKTDSDPSAAPADLAPTTA